MSTDRAHKNPMLVPGAIIQLHKTEFWDETPEGVSERFNESDEFIVMFVFSVITGKRYRSLCPWYLTPEWSSNLAVTGMIVGSSVEELRDEYTNKTITAFIRESSIIKVIASV